MEGGGRWNGVEEGGMGILMGRPAWGEVEGWSLDPALRLDPKPHPWLSGPNQSDRIQVAPFRLLLHYHGKGNIFLLP